MSVFRVLKYQKSIFAEQIPLQNKVDNRIATLQIVGSVREYHIKLLATALQIQKYVGVCGVEVGKSQLLSRLANEGVMHGVYLHTCHAPRTPRTELITNRARAREQIQHVNLLEIHKIAEHIEEVFLSKVGRWASPQIAWGDNGPTSIFTTNNPHNFLVRLYLAGICCVTLGLKMLIYAE